MYEVTWSLKGGQRFKEILIQARDDVLNLVGSVPPTPRDKARDVVKYGILYSVCCRFSWETIFNILSHHPHACISIKLYPSKVRSASTCMNINQTLPPGKSGQHPRRLVHETHTSWSNLRNFTACCKKRVCRNSACLDTFLSTWL